MTEETRKRLEDAAKESVYREYNCKGEYPCLRHMDCEMCGGYNTPYDCCECGAGDYKEGFLVGAEYGYKEAIAQCKAWMRNYFPDELDGKGFEFVKLDTILADFEAEMTKLWEDEK